MKSITEKGAIVRFNTPTYRYIPYSGNESEGETYQVEGKTFRVLSFYTRWICGGGNSERPYGAVDLECVEDGATIAGVLIANYYFTKAPLELAE